jgi:UDPglucose 6-dehydrogenase
MNIAVIGTGYVGLVTGTCFAESGNDVICVDIDEAKINMLKAGRVPFYEPGLDELVKRNFAEGRLRFTTSIREAVENSLIIFIAVGTPPGEHGSADLSHVLDVASAIGEAMTSRKVIVVKSTVPVGTCDRVREVLKSRVRGIEFEVVSNPEFLKEGKAIDDFMKPDRVVVGTDNEIVAELIRQLYAPMVRTGNPILVMDVRSSEMTKYVSNGLLATKISFMNEMAALAERMGASIDAIREAVGLDRRIGSFFLFAGLGFGGSCLPKDVKALIQSGDAAGFSPGILKAVERQNQLQRQLFLEKIDRHFDQTGRADLRGKTFAVWGLAFKPNTDDMREAPSLTIIEGLLERKAAVRVYDPVAMETARGLLGDRVEYGTRNYDILQNADGLAVVTEWNEFRNPNFQKMRDMMAYPVIFDGRNIYNPKVMKAEGFTYYSVGRCY